MTKLKTVKDIIDDLHKDESPEELQEIAYAQMVLENDVRQAAIKIKKSINDWSNEGVLHKEFKKLSGFEKLNVDTFIKWFFNITKKDLK